MEIFPYTLNCLFTVLAFPEPGKQENGERLLWGHQAAYGSHNLT